MKFLKKIGLGIISLSLISTFHIPEAKANQTIFEYTVPSSVPTIGKKKYAIKRVTSMNANFGKLLFKEVGSGNTNCKMFVETEYEVNIFVACVASRIGSDYMEGLIRAAIKEEL